MVEAPSVQAKVVPFIEGIREQFQCNSPLALASQKVKTYFSKKQSHVRAYVVHHLQHPLFQHASGTASLAHLKANGMSISEVSVPLVTPTFDTTIRRSRSASLMYMLRTSSTVSPQMDS